jgi:hypothetical protein
MAESLELIARRASEADPGVKTVAECRKVVFHAFLLELRKLFSGAQSDRSHWPQGDEE